MHSLKTKGFTTQLRIISKAKGWLIKMNIYKQIQDFGKMRKIMQSNIIKMRNNYKALSRQRIKE